MPRTPPLALLLAFAALAIGGCGEEEEPGATVSQQPRTSETTETPTRPAAPPAKGVVATVEVELTEFELDPANPGVEDAGKVAFEVANAGEVDHALAVEGPKGERETDDIAPGKRATMTVDLGKPGKYRWYCPIGDHAQQGMAGSVFIAYDKVQGSDQPREEGEAGPGSDGHGGY